LNNKLLKRIEYENAMLQYIDNSGSTGGISGGLFGGLNETEKGIISLIKENQHIKVFEMAQKLLKPVRTIENNISLLKEKGIIVRIGSRKTGCWKLTIK
jgi:predicted HTH transcriptional regulator